MLEKYDLLEHDKYDFSRKYQAFSIRFDYFVLLMGDKMTDEDTKNLRDLTDEKRQGILKALAENRIEIWRTWTTRLKVDKYLADYIKYWLILKKIRAMDKNNIDVAVRREWLAGYDALMNDDAYRNDGEVIRAITRSLLGLLVVPKKNVANKNQLAIKQLET